MNDPKKVQESDYFHLIYQERFHEYNDAEHGPLQLRFYGIHRRVDNYL